MTPVSNLIYFVVTALLLFTITFAIRACVIDAKRRGKSPLLVTLLMVFFPLGLIIWLLFRPTPLSGEVEPRKFRLQDFRVQ